MVQRLTGRPLAFKRFTPGGNLLVMNVDMEHAQIIGAARSILKTNVPEYSTVIDAMKPEDFAQLFVRICLTHAKR